MNYTKALPAFLKGLTTRNSNKQANFECISKWHFACAFTFWLCFVLLAANCSGAEKLTAMYTEFTEKRLMEISKHLRQSDEHGINLEKQTK